MLKRVTHNNLIQNGYEYFWKALKIFMHKSTNGRLRLSQCFYSELPTNEESRCSLTHTAVCCFFPPKQRMPKQIHVRKHASHCLVAALTWTLLPSSRIT